MKNSGKKQTTLLNFHVKKPLQNYGGGIDLSKGSKFKEECLTLGYSDSCGKIEQRPELNPAKINQSKLNKRSSESEMNGSSDPRQKHGNQIEGLKRHKKEHEFRIQNLGIVESPIYPGVACGRSIASLRRFNRISLQRCRAAFVNSPNRRRINENINEDGNTKRCIPLCARYSNGSQNGINLFAVSDEGGFFKIMDTRTNLTSSREDVSESIRVVSDWQAHRDSVFNFLWTADDTHIVTASADCMLALWDVEYKKRIDQYAGHSETIYALDMLKHDSRIVASGGRDGSIRLWDTRTGQRRGSSPGSYSGYPLSTLHAAHQEIVQETSPRLKRSAVRSNYSKSASKRVSVSAKAPIITSLAFLLDAHTLCSSSSSDGTIHFWDIRNLVGANAAKSRTIMGKTSLEFKKSRGVSCIAADPLGKGIYSLSIDNCIYYYDTLIPSSPVAVLSSEDLIVSTFHTKFQPGYSSDSVLYAHSEEVTCISSCPWIDPVFGSYGLNSIKNQILSISDDCNIKLWDNYTENSINPFFNYNSIQEFADSPQTASNKYSVEIIR
ncbi:hypothetical protein BB560_004850 [Smittium megazygosporum]|uniref:Uncharacterized protein n=1 Tax=Smittium megazygosporum TaxID=133381 RepID=A0A2T9Z835_9FUNG|nr:hypothetical protein BB560_004850 [Smittium megazygosporum]